MIDKVVSILLSLPAVVFGTVIVLTTLTGVALIGAVEFAALNYMIHRI